MLKRSKLLSILFIVVASTVIGLFGAIENVTAQAPAGTLAWTKDKGQDSVSDGGIDYIKESRPEIVEKRKIRSGSDYDCFRSPNRLLFSRDDGSILFLVCIDGPNATSATIAKSYTHSSECATDPELNHCDIGSQGVETRPFAPNTSTDGTVSDPDDENDGTGEGTQEDKESPPSSCQIKGVGWLICPLVYFLAEVTDNSYNLLDKTLLRVSPLILPGDNTSKGMQLYEPWKSIRDFANIIFIIGFLFIVLSQITNIGISNYGIKKLLPKIVIAAILVNLSYYLCAIAIDISNILGNQLRGILMPDTGSVINFKFTYPVEGEGDKPFATQGWTGLAGIVIGASATLSLVYVFLPIFLPMIIGAVISVITVVLVLTLRQALIVMLVILSPLAFVALLLPNTENYFHKWRSLFISMLIIYPMISVIFGASALASTVLMDATDDFWLQMVGAGVSIIPLAITPIVLKVSGGLLNRWAGIVNDPSKGFFDSKRKSLTERGQMIRAGRAARVGRFVNKPKGMNGALGGSGSRRRRWITAGTGYASNTRERTRKDQMAAMENSLETTYLGSNEGRRARGESKNSQIRVENAQLITDSVRLSSAEGIILETENVSAKMEQKMREDRAQSTAIHNAALSGQAADAKRAELGRKLAETQSYNMAMSSMPSSVSERIEEAEAKKSSIDDNFKAGGLTALAGSASGQAVLRDQREAAYSKEIAENNAESMGRERASNDKMVQAETSSQNLANIKDHERQVYEEVAAKGDSDPTLLSTHGVIDTTAKDAQTSSFQSKATKNAVSRATREGEVQYSKEVGNNPTLAAQAGGNVDPHGESGAKAQARAVVTKAFNDAVSIEESTMTDLKPADLNAIRFDLTQSEERRTAATGMLAKTGGMSDIIDTFTALGSAMALAQRAPASPARDAEIQALKSMQQQFMAEVGNKLPASVTGKAKGDMSTGQYEGNLANEVLESLKEGRYSGEKLATLHPKELAFIKDTITAAKAAGGPSFTAAHATQLTTLQGSITEYKRVAPSLGKGLAGEVATPMSDIEII